MKYLDKLAALAIFAVTTIPQAHAQMKDMDRMHKGMDMHNGMDMKGEKAATTPGQVHRATSTVTKFDTKGGTITIAHEPVPSMKWPSMTMAFTVRDKAMLDKVTVGKKIDFEFVQEGRNYVLTGVK